VPDRPRGGRRLQGRRPIGHAVAWLTAQGYDAVNLDGGMLAWAAARRPVVTDDGTPGVVV
jgi:hypothetical protein